MLLWSKVESYWYLIGWVILSVGVPLVTNVEAFKLIGEVNILLALPIKARIFCLDSL
jgi:hypothetical protein